MNQFKKELDLKKRLIAAAIEPVIEDIEERFGIEMLFYIEALVEERLRSARQVDLGAIGEPV